MLKISKQVVTAFEAEGRQTIRHGITTHWLKDLRSAHDLAGEALREDIIRTVADLARDDPSLATADLIMYADLMLVEAVNQNRTSRH